MSKVLNNNQIKNEILKCFQKKETWYRKELINFVIQKYEFNENELKDEDSSSDIIKIKSQIGSVISSLLATSILSIDPSKLIRLGTKDIIHLNKNQIEIFVKDNINNDISISDIKSLAKYHFKVGETQTNEDDNYLNKEITLVIRKLVDQAYIKIFNNIIRKEKDFSFPNTEIGLVLEDSLHSKDIFPYFIEAFNIKGGEFLEQYATNLFAKVYNNVGYTIVSKNVCGGSNDGGVDGIIKYKKDNQLFTSFIQTKQRKNMLVTVKEIREFYGVMSLEHANIGIFVTNSDYHELAKDFINRADNLIAIDAEKLYELSKEQEYGIIKKKGKYVIDSKIFL